MSINLLADIFKRKRALQIPEQIARKFSDESVCRQCGQCCYSSVLYEDRLVIIPELPCKYLVKKSDTVAVCAIYPNRHQLVKWCNPVNQSTVAKGLFPDDCPYVKDIPGYVGKTQMGDSGKKEFYMTLRRTFPNQMRPEYINESDWDKFLLKLKNLT
jgi:uncharacterized cysteine cluster protein YcgN (CxxCxxCC family)